jgi:hypothetical protein
LLLTEQEQKSNAQIHAVNTVMTYRFMTVLYYVQFFSS